MADIVDKLTRSKMMSNIKSTNTKPEILIRKSLFSKGFRYRINVKHLPGKPDMVFRKYSAVIFINGCFWHQHTCAKSKLPETNKMFWEKKLSDNIARDKRNIDELLNLGWRVCIIWECAIKKTQMLAKIIQVIIDFLNSDNNYLEIEGTIYD